MIDAARSRARLAAALFLAALAPAARAQFRIPLVPSPDAGPAEAAPLDAAPEYVSADPEEDQPARSQAELDALARVHDRAQLHPGEALELSGREQGDNDLRARTSALARNQASTPSIDAEALYVRMRAIYDNRAVFHRALPAVGGPPVLSEESEPEPEPRAALAAAGVEDVPSATWPLIPIGAILAAFAVALAVRHRRHATTRPVAKRQRTLAHVPD